MGAVDMALGIIVGTTFGKIVTSFFKEVIIVPNRIINWRQASTNLLPH